MLKKCTSNVYLHTIKERQLFLHTFFPTSFFNVPRPSHVPQWNRSSLDQTQKHYRFVLHFGWMAGEGASLFYVGCFFTFNKNLGFWFQTNRITIDLVPVLQTKLVTSLLAYLTCKYLGLTLNLFYLG